MTGPGRRPYHTCGLVKTSKFKQYVSIADELKKLTELKAHLTDEQYKLAVDKILS